MNAIENCLMLKAIYDYKMISNTASAFLVYISKKLTLYHANKF
jgi:hypothetical protein